MDEKNVGLVVNALVDLGGDDVSLEEMGAGLVRYAHLIGAIDGQLKKGKEMKKELAGTSKK